MTRINPKFVNHGVYGHVTPTKIDMPLPSEIFSALNSNIRALEKIILYVIYRVLKNTNYCYMSNQYLSEATGHYSKSTISKALSRLNKDEYIKIYHKTIKNAMTGQIYPNSRYITVGKKAYTLMSDRRLQVRNEYLTQNRHLTGKRPMTKNEQGVDYVQPETENSQHSIAHSQRFQNFNRAQSPTHQGIQQNPFGPNRLDSNRVEKESRESDSLKPGKKPNEFPKSNPDKSNKQVTVPNPFLNRQENSNQDTRSSVDGQSTNDKKMEDGKGKRSSNEQPNAYTYYTNYVNQMPSGRQLSMLKRLSEHYPQQIIIKAIKVAQSKHVRYTLSYASSVANNLNRKAARDKSAQNSRLTKKAVCVVNLFNKMTKSSYRPFGPNLVRIKKLLRHHFSIHDFKAAIKSRIKYWGDDRKMKPLISRIDIVFGRHFQDYINSGRFVEDEESGAATDRQIHRQFQAEKARKERKSKRARMTPEQKLAKVQDRIRATRDMFHGFMNTTPNGKHDFGPILANLTRPDLRKEKELKKEIAKEKESNDRPHK